MTVAVVCSSSLSQNRIPGLGLHNTQTTSQLNQIKKTPPVWHQVDPEPVSWLGDVVYLLGWDVHSHLKMRSRKTIGSENQETWFLFSAGH